MRPSGPKPFWATTLNYPAGVFSYSGTPTRVDPGGALGALGYTPGFTPSAQHFNFELGRTSDFLAGYDNIDIQSWRLDTGGILGATTLAINGIAVDPANGSLWAVGVLGGTVGAFYSYNAVDWFDDTANLPASADAMNAIAFAPRSGSAGEWLGSGTGGHFIVRTEAGVYSRTALASFGTANINCVLWDSVNTKFVLAGEADPSTHNTSVWTVDSSSLAQAKLTLANAAGVGTAAKFLAFGAGSPRYILITANSRIWDTDILTNTWVDRTTATAFPFSGTVIGMVWNPTTLSYLVVTTANSYVSFDGITWTAQGSSGLVGVPQANILACRGGTWVVSTLVTFAGGSPASVFMLAYSIDNGANWQMMPFPDQRISSGTPFSPITIQPGPGDLVLVSKQNGIISVCSTLKAR